MRLNKEGLTAAEMVKYIIPLLKAYQLGKCTVCGEELFDCQIHHKRYGEDINIYDLELIHGQCHADTHGKRSCNGTLRH